VPSKPKNFYLFEGKQMSLPEIRSLVPCLSTSGILGGIKRGATCRRTLLAYDLSAAKRRAGRMGGTPSMRSNYPQRSY